MAGGWRDDAGEAAIVEVEEKGGGVVVVTAELPCSHDSHGHQTLCRSPGRREQSSQTAEGEQGREADVSRGWGRKAKRVRRDGE